MGALYRRLAAARRLQDSELAQRQQAVKKVVGEIVVDWKWVNRGSRKCWLLNEVTISPQLGEAVTYSQPLETMPGRGMC